MKINDYANGGTLQTGDEFIIARSPYADDTDNFKILSDNLFTNFTGSVNIDTLGDITTGEWKATIIGPTYGGTGVANPTAHGIAIAEGSSNFVFKTLTNGQLLIGSTGNDPVQATLTAGTNITITNGVGAITIAASGHASFTWNEITGTSQTMASNNGYIANNAALVTLTLPATSIVGDVITVVGKGAGGWKVAQGTSQLIHYGDTATTTGTGGSISSSNQFDCFTMVCTVANTTWTVLSSEGNLTVV